MQIRLVTVRNFRGIRRAEWWLPPQRFMCLVGAGDSTKTTLLDAISLVLAPRPNVTFSDADFYECDVAQQIVLRVLIGDLTAELLDAETGYGMWLTGLTPAGELEHDPAPESELCVMLQLTVDSDLEPTWTVVRYQEQEQGVYEDAMLLTARRRRAFGLFRVDERVDSHLRWGRGSALAQLTDGDTNAAVTAVRRSSRETVFNDAVSNLQTTADQVADAARSIGGGHFTALRPGWDPVAYASPSNLLLHEGTVPLSHAGMGSRRLISIAAQELATQDGNVLLVDEIEHGLEPHRLLHVLHELRQRSERRRGQVITTTHSPIAVQTIAATDISVVRNDKVSGVTEVIRVPDKIRHAQGAVRAGPTALLARKVVVGEGATEAGMLRALIRRWDDERSAGQPNHAALGVTFFNGGGSEAPIRAKVYQGLGIAAALLVDNDDRGIDKNVEEAESAGVMIARWRSGYSTETEIISVLSEFDDLHGIVELGIEHKSSEAVSAHLCVELPRLSQQEDPCSPTAWAAAGYSVDQVQAAIAMAAGGGAKKETKKAWFKREDAGEALGHFIYQRWSRYRETDLGTELTKIREFIYGDEEPIGSPNE